jgi:hypothetical protein
LIVSWNVFVFVFPKPYRKENFKAVSMTTANRMKEGGLFCVFAQLSVFFGQLYQRCGGID